MKQDDVDCGIACNNEKYFLKICGYNSPRDSFKRMKIKTKINEI